MTEPFTEGWMTGIIPPPSGDNSRIFQIDQLTRANAFEAEIRAEQEELKRKAEEKKQRHQEFLSKKCVFQQS